MIYNCIRKHSLNIEDSEILQSNNVNNIPRQHVAKKHQVFEALDVCTKSILDVSGRKLSVPNDEEICSSLNSFILMYEQNQLKNTTDVTNSIERYFTLYHNCELDVVYTYQIHMFHTAAEILLEAKVENSILYGKLFKLMGNNVDIQCYVMNHLRPDHLYFFLKQLRMGGYNFNFTNFPLSVIDIDASIDQCLVLLQFIDHLRNSYEDVSDFVEGEFGKQLSEVVPNNYSSERLDLILLMLELRNAEHDFIAAMTLIWRSVPHAYLTNTEVKDVLKKLISDIEEQERMLQICENFNQIFIFPTMRPRSLKHYARTSFRNFFQIPEAIDNSNLPKSLKSYLKLYK